MILTEGRTFITLKEAAEIMPITYQALKLRVYRNAIPHYRIKGIPYFDRKEIQAYVDNGLPTYRGDGIEYKPGIGIMDPALIKVEELEQNIIEMQSQLYRAKFYNYYQIAI